jgi:hypothetical protein
MKLFARIEELIHQFLVKNSVTDVVADVESFDLTANGCWHQFTKKGETRG